MLTKMYCVAGGLLLFLVSCSAIRRGSKKEKETNQGSAVANNKDTVRKGVKAYKDVITSQAVTRDGLLKVHKVDTRFYFEVNDSVLNKDLLVVNRISRGAAEMRLSGGDIGFAGDYIGENVIRFEKGPNQKVFVRRVSYLEISNDSSENGLYRSILNSSLQPIVAAFDVKAVTPDSSALVLDVTDYLNGDNDIFFFDPRIKKRMGLGGSLADKSYIDKILSFPKNTEIRTVKTYSANDQLITFELNSSIVLLPAEPMKPRFFDERVGYFARGYLNFDLPQRVKPDYMITRWRLEPREQDKARYLRGELVEPEKPIVFYIDPATPKKWVPYLIKGVNAWQKSFEKAGFKNAVYAIEVPAHDTTWSLEDARHNVIVYKASDMQNASGPQVSDPRTGEILESHINWYHNVQQLLHDWYMVQAAPNDPRARQMTFDDALMGELISYVCTHEVGHTLGLQHNFMASATIPVDSLRNRWYVAKYGHTPSIMDYARFNYVAQPEDSIDVRDLVPRIGAYDDWAIEWGYKILPEFSSLENEKKYLNDWIIARTTKNAHLLYNSMLGDMRVQAEDLGDEASKASTYGIKNLKRVMVNLKSWTSTPDDLYDNLKSLQQKVINQYQQYLEHVIGNFLGVYWMKKSTVQNEPCIDFPTRDKLRACIGFFQDQLFTTPEWLDNHEIFSYVGGGGMIERLQAIYLQRLVSPDTYNMLCINLIQKKQDKPYTYDEFLTDMETGIFSELKSSSPIDFHRRHVQKEYVNKLINNIRQQKTGFLGRTDFTTISEDHVRNLYALVSKVKSRYVIKESRLHLEDMATRLKVAMDYQQKNYPETGERMGSVTAPRAFAGLKEMFESGGEAGWRLRLQQSTLNCWNNEVELKGDGITEK